MMFFNCPCYILLGILLVAVDALTTGLLEDVIKADQVMRPKAKRAQEMLMFGNQQNRRPENPSSSNVFSQNSEKRTLGTSGLEDVKSSLSDDETFNHPKELGWSEISEGLSNRNKNYEYGKVMMNEVNDDLPSVWNLPPYPRYFGLDEERRKRSEKNVAISSGSPSLSTTVAPSATSLSPIPATQSTPRPNLPIVQSKRSIPIYPEPRYKRALVDREDLLALLSLWENQPRNRNWRSYGNDEYENIEDDGNYVGVEEEDPRGVGGVGVGGSGGSGGAWLEGPVYTPHHFSIGPEIAASDVGIPRTHPINSYEQYNSQYAPYESTQYGTAQYGSLYPHNTYYPPEKRFMISRKRSQGYDNYAGRSLNDIVSFSQLMNSQPQGYANYPQRMLY